MRSFPELIDIGIMGTCISAEKGLCAEAGIDCYQSALICRRPNMSFENYCKIINQCKGRTFQVALGGAGDPNKHDCFEEILSISRKNLIVPNMTTSGNNLTDSEITLIKKYCGAVAVSFYSRLVENDKETNNTTISAIERLVKAGCTTNVHYVLSKKSIREAIYRIENNKFPKGINAVIFLLYKPVGLAKKENMLTYNDSKYIELIQNIAKYKGEFEIGFDSCQSPAVLRFSNDVAIESVQFCDATRFSMYIDCEMKAYPCSFGINFNEYSIDINHSLIEAAWNSQLFESFREKQAHICNHCLNAPNCRNCVFDIGVNVCGEL